MDHQWTPALEQWLREQAVDAGFNTAGIASVDPAPDDLDAQRFADWIAQGRAGEMDYLKRRDENGNLLRSAVQVAVPWARSIIVCALNYDAAAPLSDTNQRHSQVYLAFRPVQRRYGTILYIQGRHVGFECLLEASGIDLSSSERHQSHPKPVLGGCPYTRFGFARSLIQYLSTNGGRYKQCSFVAVADSLGGPVTR